MKIGSMAIADRAEYGDACPLAIVPIGKSISRSNPDSASHAESGPMSPSSPMPQLDVVQAEKSGNRRPA
jgi:hypothetical protein